MPAFWQVTKLRAEQTLAVWNLDATFKVGAKTRTDLETFLTGYEPLVEDYNEAKLNAGIAIDARNGVVEQLRMLCVKGAGKMSADLEDDDPLDVALGSRVFSIDPHRNESELISRCNALLPIWKDYQARLSALTPPETFTIRGAALTDFEALLDTDYETAVDGDKTAGTEFSKAGTLLEQHNRKVDRLIKAWYKAWKDEYPAGTPEGDALLSEVEAEQGQHRPTPLEIASLTETPGFHVAVAFGGGGTYATARHLQIKIVGVDADWRLVRIMTAEDVAAGVQIGPFAAGQQILVRTDVGNSRDSSELGPEASITLA